MVKIRINKHEQTFNTSNDAMVYVADTAGDSALEFQRLEYDGDDLVQMDYLTYYQGHLKETYSTRM